MANNKKRKNTSVKQPPAGAQGNDMARAILSNEIAELDRAIADLRNSLELGQAELNRLGLIRAAVEAAKISLAARAEKEGSAQLELDLN